METNVVFKLTRKNIPHLEAKDIPAILILDKNLQIESIKFIEIDINENYLINIINYVLVNLDVSFIDILGMDKFYSYNNHVYAFPANVPISVLKHIYNDKFSIIRNSNIVYTVEMYHNNSLIEVDNYKIYKLSIDDKIYNIRTLLLSNNGYLSRFGKHIELLNREIPFDHLCYMTLFLLQKSNTQAYNVNVVVNQNYNLYINNKFIGRCNKPAKVFNLIENLTLEELLSLSLWIRKEMDLTLYQSKVNDIKVISNTMTKALIEKELYGSK